MTRRFGIYAKVTPKQPRLVLTAGIVQIASNADSNEELDRAFTVIRALVFSMSVRKYRRAFRRSYLRSQSYQLVARLVRNRNRGAASGMAQ